MLRAILNKSWKQHPTRHQLYGHLPPTTKTIQVRWTIYAGHYWRSRDELISDVLLWTPSYGQTKQDGHLEHTYSSSVRIRDEALKTFQKRWRIGRSGERRSAISVPAARHDDIYIYIYSPTTVGLSSLANYVIALPLMFIARLFIYELSSR